MKRLPLEAALERRLQGVAPLGPRISAQDIREIAARQPKPPSIEIEGMVSPLERIPLRVFRHLSMTDEQADVEGGHLPIHRRRSADLNNVVVDYALYLGPSESGKSGQEFEKEWVCVSALRPHTNLYVGLFDLKVDHGKDPLVSQLPYYRKITEMTTYLSKHHTDPTQALQRVKSLKNAPFDADKIAATVRYFLVGDKPH